MRLKKRKRYTVIDNRTGLIYNYSFIEWNLFMFIVWLFAFLTGLLF